MNRKTLFRNLINSGLALAIFGAFSIGAREIPQQHEVVYPLEICQLDQILQSIAESERVARSGAQRVYDLAAQAQQSKMAEDASLLLAQALDICEEALENSHLSAERFSLAFEAFPLFIFHGIERDMKEAEAAIAQGGDLEEVEKARADFARNLEKREDLIASIDKKVLLDVIVSGLDVVQTQILLGQATVYLTEALFEWEGEDMDIAKTLMDLARERTQESAFRLRLAIALFDAAASLNL